MKSTAEYLFEFAIELSSKMDSNKVGKLSEYEMMNIITQLCNEYASLIDAVKDIK